MTQEEISSFQSKERHGKTGIIGSHVVEVLSMSDCALTLEELKERIRYEHSSDFSIEVAILQLQEIKIKKIGQVMKEFNLKKYRYGVNPQTRIFYLNEAQVDKFARKSRHYCEKF